eukprot:ctg_415.g134
MNGLEVSESGRQSQRRAGKRSAALRVEHFLVRLPAEIDWSELDGARAVLEGGEGAADAGSRWRLQAPKGGACWTLQLGRGGKPSGGAPASTRFVYCACLDEASEEEMFIDMDGEAWLCAAETAVDGMPDGAAAWGDAPSTKVVDDGNDDVPLERWIPRPQPVPGGAAAAVEPRIETRLPDGERERYHETRARDQELLEETRAATTVSIPAASMEESTHTEATPAPSSSTAPSTTAIVVAFDPAQHLRSKYVARYGARRKKYTRKILKRPHKYLAVTGGVPVADARRHKILQLQLPRDDAGSSHKRQKHHRHRSAADDAR